MSDYDLHMEMLHAETSAVKVNKSMSPQNSPQPERSNPPKGNNPVSIAKKGGGGGGEKNSQKEKEAASKKVGGGGSAKSSSGNVLDFFGGTSTSKRGSTPEPQDGGKNGGGGSKDAAKTKKQLAQQEQQEVLKKKAQTEKDRKATVKKEAADAKAAAEKKPSRREATRVKKMTKASELSNNHQQRSNTAADSYSDSSSCYDDDITIDPRGGGSRWDRNAKETSSSSGGAWNRNEGGTVTSTSSGAGANASSAASGSGGTSTSTSNSIPRMSREEERNTLNSTVYLKYLSNNTTRKHLRDTLDECGLVEKVRVCEPKGAESAFMYGFVQFATPEAANKLSAGKTPLMKSSNIICSTSHNLINDKIAGDVVKGGPFPTSAFGAVGRDSKYDCTLKQFAIDSFGGGSGGSAAVSGSAVKGSSASSAAVAPGEDDSFPSLPGNPVQSVNSAASGSSDSVLNKLKMAGLQVGGSSTSTAVVSQQPATPEAQPHASEMDQLIGRTTEAIEEGMSWMDSGCTVKKSYAHACHRFVSAGNLVSGIVTSAQDEILKIRNRKKQEKANGGGVLLGSGTPEHQEHVAKLMAVTELELTVDVIAVALHVSAGDASRREIRAHAQNTLAVVRDRVSHILSFTTDAAAPPRSEASADDFTTLAADLIAHPAADIGGVTSSDTAAQPLLIAEGSAERERFICHVVNCLLTMGMLLEKESQLLSNTLYSMSVRRIKDELCGGASGGGGTLLPTVACTETNILKCLRDCLASGGKLSFADSTILSQEAAAKATNGHAVSQYIFSVADLPPPDLPEELPVVAIQMFNTVVSTQPTF